MFSLESPHRGDSNEYTHYTIFNIKKKIALNYPISAAMFFCSKGLKNEFETALVNEPSVFEPLKFYCIYLFLNPRMQLLHMYICIMYLLYHVLYGLSVIKYIY